jgi:hypothetical protein
MRYEFTEEQIKHLRYAIDSHIHLMNDRATGYETHPYTRSIEIVEELDKILMKAEVEEGEE